MRYINKNIPDEVHKTRMKPKQSEYEDSLRVKTLTCLIQLFLFLGNKRPKLSMIVYPGSLNFNRTPSAVPEVPLSPFIAICKINFLFLSWLDFNSLIWDSTTYN